MELKLYRETLTDTYTGGRLFVNGAFECYTLEDAVRDEKIPGATAIPTGKYDVIWNMSNRFKKMMPLLMNVPDFAGVRIHSGNTIEDTNGCILVGLILSNGELQSSRIARDLLYPQIADAYRKGEKITIEILNR